MTLLRRYGFDLVIAVTAVASTIEVALADGPGTPTSRLAVPATAILIGSLLGRRRWPFGAPVSLWLLAAALSFVDGRLVAYPTGVMLAGMVAAFLLGNLADAREGRIGLAVVVAGALIVSSNDPNHDTGDLIFQPVLFAIAWLAGFGLRGHAAQAEAAEERAARAERDREVAARIAVAEERARIARELHDIVAHAVSVMVLQVGAVRHRLPADVSDDDREALVGVERTGRSALAEMRRLLGALRAEDDDVELAPQPGLAGLDSLLDEFRRSGLPVELQVDGERVPLPRALDLSAYRIVQEGLTNVLKHARRAACGRGPALRRRRAADRDPRRRHRAGGRRRRPRSRAGRRPRTRQGLRRLDERGARQRRRLPAEHAAPAMTIRVLVADDQSMVRAGFRLLLAGEPGIEVVAEARTGLEAVEKAGRFDPTVVLMDIRMPELDGIEATRRILAADSTARVLILTTFDLDEYVYEALSAGASGFVLKDDPPEQLIAAIRTIAGGEALLSPAVTSRVIRQFTRRPRPSPPPGLEELTAREMDVFRLIARGHSNAEIGAQLSITDTTVKTHVTKVLQKLDLRDRVQAVVLAYETGIFEAETP